MSNPTKKPTPVTIGEYVIDASVSESHTFESEVTEFPVEQGSAISDNIRPKPIVVTLEGVVSDTPIGNMAVLRNQLGDPAADGTGGQLHYVPSTDALKALLAIRDARQPVTIATTLQRFENMALTNLEIPRDAQTGAALRFTATFQQITIVTNQRTTVRTTAVRTSSPGDAAKSNKGKWSTQTQIDGIYVVTFPVASRSTASKSFGPPILTDSIGDHYRVNDKSDTKPDGYIGKDNKYHQLTVSNGATTSIPTTINGRPVHYDYGQGAWVDDKSNTVSKTVPKGMDRWSFVNSSFGPARF